EKYRKRACRQVRYRSECNCRPLRPPLLSTFRSFLPRVAEVAMQFWTRFASAALLAVAPAALAQDVSSGPDKDAKVPALKVFDATGPNKDKDVDYAAERKDKPTIYLLVRADKFDRPMNRFAKGLDDRVKKDSEDAYIVAVWLTDDVDKAKERLPAVQQSVQ